MMRHLLLPPANASSACGIALCFGTALDVARVVWTEAVIHSAIHDLFEFDQRRRRWKFELYDITSHSLSKTHTPGRPSGGAISHGLLSLARVGPILRTRRVIQLILRMVGTSQIGFDERIAAKNWAGKNSWQVCVSSRGGLGFKSQAIRINGMRVRHTIISSDLNVPLILCQTR